MRFDRPSVQEYSRRPIKWIFLLLLAGNRYHRYNAPVEGKTRLMKMLFLLETRFGEVIEPRHKFEPYRFGPHSWEVQEELDEMVALRLARKVEGFRGDTFLLTPEGVKTAMELSELTDDEDAHSAIRNIKNHYSHMPLNALLHLVYEEYPGMATESEYQEPFEWSSD